MGEVYRARDARLQRDVAIKLLPASVAADPDRLARFTREAQLLATLNHPNIGAIYGVEESDAGAALVLELVEGPTLADRIAHGPVAPDDAIAIARQGGVREGGPALGAVPPRAGAATARRHRRRAVSVLVP
jgi:serine/threonine-protein kinase